MTHPICVLGTVNMDLVIQAPSMPRPGESVAGTAFEFTPGGKGANRAAAAARLGEGVQLVGCVGDDAWGSDLRGTLAAEGVGLAHLVTKPNERTGVSVIGLVPGGRTALIGVGAANDSLSPEDIDAAKGAIAEASALILHNELPEEAVLRAIAHARAAGTSVCLHAVPSGPVPAEVLSEVDLLVCREVGARAITGCEDDVSASGLARRLQARGPNRVVITLGSRGALAFDGEKVVEQEGFRVEAVDTTATGAAFVAALVAARSHGERTAGALRFACAAGALAATRAGSLSSLPTREEVAAFLEAAG